MEKQSRKNNSVLILIVLAAGLFLSFLSAFHLGKNAEWHGVQDLSYLRQLLQYEGWQQISESNNAVPVTLPGRRMQFGQSGIVLVNRLPHTLESGFYLAFENRNCTVSVSVDGELLFENPGGKNLSDSASWVFIPLATDHAEKEIRVELHSKDSYYTGVLPEIFLGPVSELRIVANMQDTLNIQLSICIIFFGLMVVLFSLITFATATTATVTNFLFLGIYLFLLGVSLLCQIPSADAPDRRSYTVYNLGSSLFLMLPVLYCLFQNSRIPYKNKRIYTAVILTGVIWFFTAQMINRFSSMTVSCPLHYINGAVMEFIYFFCFVTAWNYNKSRKAGRMFTCISFLFLMIGIALYSFTYVGYVYLRNNNPLVIFSLVFALLQTISAFLFTYEFVEEQLRITKELSNSRIRQMTAQMKPHFIRASLGAIRSIIPENPQKAYDMLYNFTNYLTFRIEALDSSELVPFSEELRQMKAYTVIEQERYKPRITVKYLIETEAFEVPPLSLQPFVENAIKHGVWPKHVGGTVTIYTREQTDCFQIIIEDDGVGFDTENPPEPAPGHGIGMKNSIQCLENLVQATVTIKSTPGTGTTVDIRIPKRKDVKNENHFGG